jgi:hypothetical protein
LSVLTYGYLYSLLIPIFHSSPNLSSSFPLYSNIPILFFSSLIPSSSPLPSSHSFYTCRYLHILIYIIPIFPNKLSLNIKRNTSSIYLSILKGIHLLMFKGITHLSLG